MKARDGKAGLYRIEIDGRAGNRVEETIYAHEMILPTDGSPPFTATQAFRSTSSVVGREMLNRAFRKVQGEDITNPVTRKWRMTSQMERRGDYRWFKPVATLLGKFGEPNGPTIEQVRLGAQLRKAFKDGATWEAPLEPPEPPAAHLASMSGHEQRRAPIITSGRSALKAVETPPPLEPYDDGPDDRRDGGPDYEGIPF